MSRRCLPPTRRPRHQTELLVWLSQLITRILGYREVQASQLRFLTCPPAITYSVTKQAPKERHGAELHFPNQVGALVGPVCDDAAVPVLTLAERQPPRPARELSHALGSLGPVRRSVHRLS